MQWDFWTLSPESAHQVSYLMGDRGIPSTWRQMNLYGSHTYMWVNADGESFWVKYHFISDQGVENFTQAEADQLASADTDYHTRDLFEAIGHGGISLAATAITGNLTITGQTAGGYGSITPNPVANPATSTINFPLGDTRANGVTVPLNVDGELAIVYKAGAGKKTHMIVDVTGYFR